MKTGRNTLMIVAALLAALSLAFVAGCGDDDDDADAPATTTEQATTAAPATTEGGTDTGGATEGEPTVLDIPTDPSGALAYEVTEVTAPAGEVTLRSPNESVVPHNIAVDEPEEQIGEIVQSGGVSEITVDFPAGEYEYYCSVPGHRQAGMVGTLTVE